MSIHYLRTELWPMPGHYHAGKVSPLSLLAFHIHLLSAQGNLLDGKRDQVFYRDSSIPTPRAATFSAWRYLLGLGHDDSPYFFVPFLPAIRSDEEGGVASSMRGAGEAGTTHLSTLTRRSRLHIRDSSGRITWGTVYIGRWDYPHSPLVYGLERSDIPESFVVPRHAQDDSRVTSHSGIRERMEFLAQFGIPATSGSSIPLISIRRILFQILNQTNARYFADAFIKARLDYFSDEDAERQDYLQLIHELREKNSAKTFNAESEAQDVSRESKKKKKVSFTMPDLNLSL